MNEFGSYDQMLGDKPGALSYPILPLLSWEFYGEHVAIHSVYKKDLEILRKISEKWDFKHNFYTEFIKKQSVILVTSPNLVIIYASHNIEKLNGYKPNEVIGNSPKMFQGEKTCGEASRKIRSAVQVAMPFEASILNYKKDQETYICEIKGFPVFNKSGLLVNYIAFERAA